MINKVLITGSNGFLGRSLFEELTKNYKTYSLSRSNSNFNFNLSIEVPFFNESFDIVIHAAGLAHKMPSNEFEKRYLHNYNIKVTKNLLKGLENNTIKKFIFISSVSVYGLIEGELINEDHQLNATDPYGLSKINSELTITDWCKSNNIKLTILRLPLIVGANPSGNLATMLNGIKNGYYFNIDGGLAKKSMVLINDISNYILKASEIGGIYNLTDSYHPNFFEFSNCISKQIKNKKIINIPIKIAIMLAVTGDFMGPNFPINSLKLKKITSTLTFDDRKAKLAFDWNPTPVLEGFKIT